MGYQEYLLSDETEGIEKKDYLERQKLVEEFSKLPEDFFSRMRHFQPQIGCLNACSICSKLAGNTTEYWSIKRIRNVIAALKHLGKTFRSEKPYMVWDRNEHRNGVIFSYLDNDIGNYFYLKDFINLAYQELGVQTRISTIGYSRYNKELNDMHKKINENPNIQYLGGVRLSFTPYPIGWRCNNGNYSKSDYTEDMANILSIYKPYYNKVGSGSRNMCVELRYEPLVEIGQVYDLEVLGHKVICIKNYLYISKETNVVLNECKIEDPYDHKIKLTEEPTCFYEIDLYEELFNKEKIQIIACKFIHANLQKNKNIREVEGYLFSNFDGIYYAINPRLTQEGNFGINIYPTTEERNQSGYVITERFLLNAMFEYKKDKGLASEELFHNAKWADVYNVVNLCKKNANKYKKTNKKDKYNYIMNKLIPMIEAYIFAIQKANYPASEFFNSNFTIDTGIICNLGRALKEFKGITFKENEPLTPTHERNYGGHKSTMTEEGFVWRLSCDYNDKILVEKLDLSATSSLGGQVVFNTKIQLEKDDEVLKTTDLNNQYLIPGQRRK